MLGNGDPKLVCTIIEVPSGEQKCNELGDRLGAVGKLDGNLVLQYHCTTERPKSARRDRSIDT